MTKKTLIIFGVILIVGIFLRTYHHQEWLHFELDQSRDAILVSTAIEHGPENLPLLGPHMRGSDLHLGPLFYYLQYASGVVFGDAPHIFAWPDLLFGILTIPLFFFFARQFFNTRLSLMLTALVATSLFFVTYSRFAWNPNAIPFWITALSLALLKITSGHPRHRTWWFSAAAVSFGVIAQLHFLAFIVATLVLIAFLVTQKVRPSWKECIASAAIICIFLAPLIIFDVNNDGKNTQAFFATVTEKSDKNDNHDFAEKTFRAWQKTSTFYWVTLTGDRTGGDMIITKQKNPSYLSFLCDKKCKTRLPSLLAALTAFTITLSIFLVSVKKTWRDKVRRRKNILLLLWLGCAALTFIPLAYQLSARFFLILLPIFIILFGIVLQTIEQRTKQYGVVITTTLVTLAIVANLISIGQDFRAYAQAQTMEIEPPRDLVQKRTDRVTLAQIKRVAAVIHERIAFEIAGPTVIVGDNSYVRSVHYMLLQNHNDMNVPCHIKRSAFERTQTPQRYILVTRTESRKQLPENYSETHDLTFEQSFGTLYLYELTPHIPAALDAPRPPDCFPATIGRPLK